MCDCMKDVLNGAIGEFVSSSGKDVVVNFDRTKWEHSLAYGSYDIDGFLFANISYRKIKKDGSLYCNSSVSRKGVKMKYCPFCGEKK